MTNLRLIPFNSVYRLPDGNPSECDPDGVYTCCNAGYDGMCGNTTDDCYSTFSVNYTLEREVKRKWEESGGKIKWRKDRKCGSFYPLPDGNPTECDPDGVYPCCSGLQYEGRCGNTANSCYLNCTLEREVERKWKESGGKIKWRKDRRCGSSYSLPDGNPTECDPDGVYPCCSGLQYEGRCGNMANSCYLNYTLEREVERKWKESGGKIKWRKDRRCGSSYSLPDDNSTECDPDGLYPCCRGNRAQCVNTDYNSYYCT